MAERLITIEQTPPKSDNDFNVQFNDNKTFDSVVWQKGYNVTVEKALKCPCKRKGQTNLIECSNCFGSGWFFINETKTKMILQSLSSKTKYNQWNEQNVGIMSLTGLSNDNLAFMDRITVVDGLERFSETLHTFLFKDQIISKSIYSIKDVDFCFLFNQYDQKLTPLQLGADFDLKNNTLLFKNNKVKAGDTLSIRYSHNPIYHILDLDRNIRVSDIKNSLGINTNESFPVHGTAKRAHYIFDSMNYQSNIENQGDLIDNTIIINAPSC